MIDLDALNAAAPADLRQLASLLGLEVARGARHDRVRVLCPWHAERSPSCDLARRDGRVVAICRSCGDGGDLFDLVAAARRVVGPDFPAAVRETALVLGVRLDVDDTADRRHPPSKSVPLGNRFSKREARAPLRGLGSKFVPGGNKFASGQEVNPPRPPLDLSGELGAVLRPLRDVAPVADYLARRGLLALAEGDGWLALDVDELRYVMTERVALGGDPAECPIGRAGLVRLTDDGYGVDWPAHLLAIPWRTLRGEVDTIQRRAIDRRGPKYVFPRGAARPTWPYGVERLAGAKSTAEIVLVEGAIDALARRALDDADRVVLGLPGAQGWRAEWAFLAAGRTVRLALDADAAGDKAAAELAPQLWEAGAVRVMRERSEGQDWAERLRGAA